MAGVDLHVHSTASDGEYAPGDVARRAAAAGLDVFALTDHDTIEGVADARRVGRDAGVRVVAGCEFSVAVGWGEMHLLAYCLPVDAPELNTFLAAQRRHRRRRAAEMVRRLRAAGIGLTLDEVLSEADGGAVGRPHVARALVARDAVTDVSAAFERYLGRGRPAFVPKRLPAVAEVTALVRRLAGVSSAAHLGGRANRTVLASLAAAGVDAVEVVHPSHDAERQRRIEAAAGQLGLLLTGGSDWHGDGAVGPPERASLGSLPVPPAWLAALEHLHQERRTPSEVEP